MTNDLMNENLSRRFVVREFVSADSDALSIFVIWDGKFNRVHLNSHKKAIIHAHRKDAVKAIRILNTRDRWKQHE